MAIVKTKNIELTKDDKTEHYSVDRVNANSDLIDKTFGNINEITLEGYVEATGGDKSVANFIKFLWKKLGSIELTDLKVKVTTWADKTLDKVLKELKDKDTEIVNTVAEYKASVDEYNTHLGTFVTRHKTANDKLEKLLRG
nr:hypothetical protein [uncultured Peptostreptococcus sp.]